MKRRKLSLFGILLSLAMVVGLLPPTMTRAEEIEEEIVADTTEEAEETEKEIEADTAEEAEETEEEIEATVEEVEAIALNDDGNEIVAVSEAVKNYVYIDKDGHFEWGNGSYWKVQDNVLVEATADDYTLCYDAGNRKLTLRNFVFASDYEYGVICTGCDITMELIGNNKVTGTREGAFGIDGSLDIIGNGTLEAVTTADNYSSAVWVGGRRFTITDAKLICRSDAYPDDAWGLNLEGIQREEDYVNNGTIEGRVNVGFGSGFIINSWMHYIDEGTYWKWSNKYESLMQGTASDYNVRYDKTTYTVEFKDFVTGDGRTFLFGFNSEMEGSFDDEFHLILTGTNKISTDGNWWIAGKAYITGSGSLELTNLAPGQRALGIPAAEFTNASTLIFHTTDSDVDLVFDNIADENIHNTGTIIGRWRTPNKSGVNMPEEKTGDSTSSQSPAAPSQSGTAESTTAQESTSSQSQTIPSNGAVVVTESQWNGVASDLNTAPGENMNVVTGETTKVPQNVLQAVEKSGKTLAMHTGKGLTFSLSRENLTDAMVKEGLDLTVTVGDSKIPDNLVNQKTAGAVLTKEISMPNHKSFGGLVNMHWALGRNNAGKYANLYRYNEANGQLEYVGVFVINSDGQAMFGIVDGAEYLITVTVAKPKDKMVTISAGGQYSVGKGDTLSKIAKRYNMSLRDLLALNPEISNPGSIRVGQKIKVR